MINARVAAIAMGMQDERRPIGPARVEARAHDQLKVLEGQRASWDWLEVPMQSKQ